MIVFPPSSITGNRSAVEPVSSFAWAVWECWFIKFLRFVNVAFFIFLSISIFRKILFFHKGKKLSPSGNFPGWAEISIIGDNEKFHIFAKINPPVIPL